MREFIAQPLQLCGDLFVWSCTTNGDYNLLAHVVTPAVFNRLRSPSWFYPDNQFKFYESAAEALADLARVMADDPL